MPPPVLSGASSSHAVPPQSPAQACPSPCADLSPRRGAIDARHATETRDFERALQRARWSAQPQECETPDSDREALDALWRLDPPATEQPPGQAHEWEGGSAGCDATPTVAIAVVGAVEKDASNRESTASMGVDPARSSATFERVSDLEGLRGRLDRSGAVEATRPQQAIADALQPVPSDALREREWALQLPQGITGSLCLRVQAPPLGDNIVQRSAAPWQADREAGLPGWQLVMRRADLTPMGRDEQALRLTRRLQARLEARLGRGAAVDLADEADFEAVLNDAGR